MKRYIGIVLTIILSIIALSACGQSLEERWQEQYDLGVRYLSEGNYEEAIIAFTAAIEIDPNRAEAYVSRGDAYVRYGDTEENLAAAQADYLAALELDDGYVDAWLGLINVYQMRGETELAVQAAEEGYSLTSDDRLFIEENSAEDSISSPENGGIPEGLLIRENWYDTDVGGLWNYTIYHYNSAGDCIEEITTTAEGELQTDIKYDNKGNVTYDYNYWDREEAGVEYINTYDATGQLIRQEAENGEDWTNYHYNEDGQLTQSVDRYGKTEYFYNENGLLIQEIGPSVIGTYEYDESGNVVTQIRCWRDDINREYAGTIISYYSYIYDEAGRVISQYTPAMTDNVWQPENHDEENKFEYVYTLDEKGNAIRQDIYHNGVYEGWREYIYS